MTRQLILIALLSSCVASSYANPQGSISLTGRLQADIEVSPTDLTQLDAYNKCMNDKNNTLGSRSFYSNAQPHEIVYVYRMGSLSPNESAKAEKIRQSVPPQPCVARAFDITLTNLKTDSPQSSQVHLSQCQVNATGYLTKYNSKEQQLLVSFGTLSCPRQQARLMGFPELLFTNPALKRDGLQLSGHLLKAGSTIYIQGKILSELSSD